MSWIDQAQQQLTNHATALRALDLIGQAAKQALVARGVDPMHVLQVIERTTDKIRAGFFGKMSEEEVTKHLSDLFAQIAKDDATVDAAIDAKFGGSND